MRNFANFIDAGHLAKTEEYFQSPRLDFGRLAAAMADGQVGAQTYYYDCPPKYDHLNDKWYHRRNGFLKALSYKAGFELRLGKLALRTCCDCGRTKYVQKQVDTQIAVDLTFLAAKGLIVQASLLAGDSDLLPAVCMARQNGCRIHLFYGHNASAALIGECDTATALSPEFLRPLILGERRNELSVAR